ncbi:PREDICTED: PRA1 family protein F3-like [Nelumbo nucifera]|uniref:PRA1 family protein n=2 Tax=Nelumbo nucifera TaxID=4432 RepID=A0A822XLC2_NELNU|nr:PREDICTED: PRA1 family protein F3-like [Nelumbo nucifera]DAD18338.1 TPA_asm: hypothetical protein HUJ06_019801 [Nelumbo nucifera]
MANYGTIHRLSKTSSSIDHAQVKVDDLSRKAPKELVLLRYMAIPSSPEAAAVRIIRNLGYFWVYYTLIIWVILLVSLVPRRRLSLIFLVVMTVVTCFYLLLLRAFPSSIILHNKFIDRRLVLALIAIITVVELILTRAAIHLLVSLAIGIPIILVHAVLRVGDDLFVSEEASAGGELVPLLSRTAPPDHDCDLPA